MMKMKMKSVALLQESIGNHNFFSSLSLYSRKEAKTKKGFTHFFLSLSLSSKRNNNGGEREGERERLLREKREERRKEFLLSFVSFFLKDEMFEKKRTEDSAETEDRSENLKEKKTPFFSHHTQRHTKRKSSF